MPTDRVPPKTSLIKRLLDRIGEEQERLDNVVFQSLLHQLESTKEVMEGIHQAIHQQDTDERQAAKKLLEKIESIKEMRDSWDDPKQIDKIIKDLQELAETLSPQGKNPGRGR